MVSKNDIEHHEVEQVADSLGISKSIIRFWEEEFDLAKRENGTMSSLELAEIKLLHHLILENSMTLEDAKIEFDKKRPIIVKKYETLDRLIHIKQGLMALKEKL